MLAASAREERRLRAVELHGEGLTQQEIAARLGVTQSSVCKWLKISRQSGEEGLKIKRRSGASCRISLEEWETLLVELAEPNNLDNLGRGRDARLPNGKRWANQRRNNYSVGAVQYVIQQKFGVEYHPEHIRRLMVQHGWPLSSSLSGCASFRDLLRRQRHPEDAS
jgi:transposase